MLSLQLRFIAALIRKKPFLLAGSLQVAGRHGEEAGILGEDQAGQGELVSALPLIPYF